MIHLSLKDRIKLAIMPALIIFGFFAVNYADKVGRAEDAALTASDKYIRDRVVMLQGNGYSCTGIEVIAPSGRNYILTAAHCRNMLDKEDYTATAIMEDGSKHETRMIDFQVDIDLMLMTAVDDNSIPIGERVALYEHVHTLTHGNRKPTYRTDGEALDVEPTMQPQVSMADEPEEYMICQYSSKHIPNEYDALGFCTMQLSSLITTASVIPGSSGGPVLNEKGELVGIASNTDGYFSGVVPLGDIQTFMANR